MQDVLSVIKQSKTLTDLLYYHFDVEVFPEFTAPEDEDGHLTYNIPGKAFAITGDGSQYILLKDGTVGFWGSEGACGRVADGIKDFFELIVNCPYWHDVVNFSRWNEVDLTNEQSVRDYLRRIEEQSGVAASMGAELPMAQEQAAEALDVPLYGDISALVVKFYACASRQPRFNSTYTENDGTTHTASGSVFEE